jgi:hypothetical protein
LLYKKKTKKDRNNNNNNNNNNNKQTNNSLHIFLKKTITCCNYKYGIPTPGITNPKHMETKGEI